MLPFSQSCENNKHPILEVLRDYLPVPARVLEVAGGTGQHAEFFSAELPWLYWQSTDIEENVASLALRLAHAGRENLPPPLSFDVRQAHFAYAPVDVIFTANSLHIMALTSVEDFFRHTHALLKPTGYVIIYGPFKYHGEFTTPSNAQFDQWLKSRDLQSGVRDCESIIRMAADAHLQLIEDRSMPANNQCLVFQKRAT